MNIHVVQPEDTIDSISEMYGISPERLTIENDIIDPLNLILGEALVIIIPDKTYIVREGDTLSSIAINQEIEIMELIRNNPNVVNRELYIGEELVISYIDQDPTPVHINGFTYPFIERSTLRKTLPYLTYLTIYSYQILRTGNLIGIDDLEIIQIAKAYGVAPIMFITAPYRGDNVDVEIAHILISDIQVQNTFIEKIIETLKDKGYYGVNIDTPYIRPEDRELYVELIANITKRLNDQGYSVTVTLAPSTFEMSTGIIYNGVDYVGLSRAANMVLYQITYEWKNPYTLPISILPFDAISQTFDNAMQLLLPEKSMVGLTIIGFLWEFPYFKAVTSANYLNYNSAMQLAYSTGSSIQFNERTKAAYFTYIENKLEYIAWFKDSRIIYSGTTYVKDYELPGFSISNIMSFVTNIWMLINVQFKIEKII